MARLIPGNCYQYLSLKGTGRQNGKKRHLKYECHKAVCFKATQAAWQMMVRGGVALLINYLLGSITVGLYVVSWLKIKKRSKWMLRSQMSNVLIYGNKMFKCK